MTEESSDLNLNAIVPHKLPWNSESKLLSVRAKWKSMCNAGFLLNL